MKAKLQWRFARLLTYTLALGLAAFVTSSAHAQVTGVYNFTGGSDGAYPLSGVVRVAGYLYGTASSGGANYAGVVYKLNPNTGAQSVLYPFTGGADGGSPESSLLYYAGNLYGTTAAGGASNAGTVFEVSIKGKESVLYSFTGGADGGAPQAAVIKDSAGNLYGTTYSGGSSSNGVVFELVRPKTTTGAWTEQVLYSFGSGSDGANPVAGLLFDKAGNLYGTTSAGGTYGDGAVFELSSSASGWTESILHDFALQADGGVPYAGLVLSAAGDLYGATTDGGQGGANGGGTIFELTPSSGGWSFNTIYQLAGWGISGSYRNLLYYGGKIYATTHCDGNDSAGTVYVLAPSGNTWNYTQLYMFTGATDGLFSFSSLILDGGYLWGTTKQGGPSGAGVVFKIKP